MTRWMLPLVSASSNTALPSPARQLTQNFPQTSQAYHFQARRWPAWALGPINIEVHQVGDFALSRAAQLGINLP